VFVRRKMVFIKNFRRCLKPAGGSGAVGGVEAVQPWSPTLWRHHARHCRSRIAPLRLRCPVEVSVTGLKPVRGDGLPSVSLKCCSVVKAPPDVILKAVP